MQNPGEIEIDLHGGPVILRASLQAARIVNGMADGFVGAYRRVDQFDLNAMATVVAAGTGGKTAADVTRCEETIYLTGIDKVQPDVRKFIDLLTRGGRAADAKDEEPGK